MTTITFDTLDLVNKLKKSGISQEQAESIVNAIAEAQDNLVTREYLDHKLDKVLAPIYTDLAVLKWMMGIVIAGILSLVLKAFF
jgi:hypothetical protein